MFSNKIIKVGGYSLTQWCKNQNILSLGFNTICTESDSKLSEKHEEFNKEFTSNILPKDGHRVLILQPARTHGKLFLKNRTEEQSLFEAKALVNTLESWIFVDEDRVNIRNIDTKTFFSTGIYVNLINNIRNRNDISAVFLNWPYLSALQRMHLGKDFKKIIYDRFLMVLQIFKQHARTTEAKLQVQLAEIPYFRSMLYGCHIKSYSEDVRDEFDRSLDGISLNASSLEEKYYFLKVKEHSIKERLKELELNRDIHRSNRKKTNLPIISVVGYTNAGKTSLIRHLTKDEKVQPKDCFFATLDFTYHDFYMKLNNKDCGMKVILLDSIGFLSEIPTNLIAAFRSTLREAIETDLLIHVVDISNKYWQQQMEFTLETLRSLHLPTILLDSIITIGTKIDRIDPLQLDNIKASIPNLISISNLSGENINILQEQIMESLLKNKGYITKHIKIDQSTSVYQWLLSNAIIQNRIVAPDGNKLLLEVIFTPGSWLKFQAQFRIKN